MPTQHAVPKEALRRADSPHGSEEAEQGATSAAAAAPDAAQNSSDKAEAAKTAWTPPSDQDFADWRDKLADDLDDTRFPTVADFEIAESKVTDALAANDLASATAAIFQFWRECVVDTCSDVMKIVETAPSEASTVHLL